MDGSANVRRELRTDKILGRTFQKWFADGGGGWFEGQVVSVDEGEDSELLFSVSFCARARLICQQQRADLEFHQHASHVTKVACVRLTLVLCAWQVVYDDGDEEDFDAEEMNDVLYNSTDCEVFNHTRVPLVLYPRAPFISERARALI